MLLELKKKSGHDKLVAMLLSDKKPLEVRAKMLVDLIVSNLHEPAALHQTFCALLQHGSGQAASAELAEMKAHYEQALAELEQGPVRPATFIAAADAAISGPKPRALVVTPDGQERLPSLHQDLKIEDIEPGMTVYLDPKGSIVLGASRWLPSVGQEATYLRRLEGTGQIEAMLHEERLVLNAASPVLEAEAAGKLKRGDRVLLCPRRQFAFRVMPGEKDRRHRFVDSSRVPQVVASRDIGKPHWALGWLIRRTRILMFRPDLLEKFDLRPRCSLLLTGPTGTGKTLTVRAFLHEFARMIEERTGRRDIGSRVIRAKVSELFSEWLGRSDKNIDEFFDDIHAIASEQIETTGGERLTLPVVVILEEAEGIARRRGEHDAGAYDRIIGTLLQRLDDPTEDFARLPLILLATSNRPDLIDSAMWRRLAGMRAHFTRLDREGLAAVLSKKLKPNYAYATHNGSSRDALRGRLIDDLVAWLFSPNGDDPGLVEVTLRDGKKIVKHRRDFLSGAVVETALSHAIDQTVFAAEQEEDDRAGLSSSRLIDAMRRHIDSLADNLTAMNAADYVDLPEHTQAANVRRLRGDNGQITELVVDD